MTCFYLLLSVFLAVLNYLESAPVNLMTHFPFIFVMLSLILVWALSAGKPIHWTSSEFWQLWN
jgi:hypothetical protein